MIQWRSLGVPVRDAALLDILLGPGPDGDGLAVYLSFLQVDAPFFVLCIDAASGAVDRLAGPRSGGVTALALSRDGSLYGGTTGPQPALVYLDREAGRFKQLDAEISSAGAVRDLTVKNGCLYASVDDVQPKILVYDIRKQQLRHAEQAERDLGALAEVDLAKGWQVQDVRLRGHGPTTGSTDDAGASGSSYVGGQEVILRHSESRTVKTLSFGYRSAGAPIHRLAVGPEDTIYGVAVQPLQLFAYDPVRQTFARLGAPGSAGQDVEAMTACQGRLYLGGGPPACLMVYEPAPTSGDHGELRLAASFGQGQACVTALAAAPEQRRLYAGTRPQQDAAGGLLLQFDPESGAWCSHGVMVSGHAVTSLAVLPGAAGLVGGSCPAAGIPAQDGDETTAVLCHWHEGEVVSRLTPVPGAFAIEALVAAGDAVYGLTDDGTFFSWQPGAAQPSHRQRIAQTGPYRHGLSLGQDGRLYAAFGERVVAISRSTFACEELGYCHGASDGWALLHEEVYMGAGVHLMEGQLPPPDEALWGFQ